MFLGSIYIEKEQETKRIAENLYSISNIGDIYALTGNIGVGKTTFARYFISKGGKEKNITSPTYNIFFKYNSNKSSIYHLDAWRLKKADEILNLGITEFFYEAIFLIEWPEKIEKFLPSNRLNINIELKKKNRILSFSGKGFWKDRLRYIYDKG